MGSSDEITWCIETSYPLNSHHLKFCWFYMFASNNCSNSASQAAQLCCSVKAVSGSWGKRPTYYRAIPTAFKHWTWNKVRVITFGQGPTVPSLVHLGSVAALRRGVKDTGGVTFFSSLTDQTESARWAQNGSKYADLRKVGPFGG